MNVRKNTVYTLEVCESEFKLILFSLERQRGMICKEDKQSIEDMISAMEEKEWAKIKY